MTRLYQSLHKTLKIQVVHKTFLPNNTIVNVSSDPNIFFTLIAANVEGNKQLSIVVAWCASESALCSSLVKKQGEGLEKLEKEPHFFRIVNAVSDV